MERERGRLAKGDWAQRYILRLEVVMCGDGAKRGFRIESPPIADA